MIKFFEEHDYLTAGRMNEIIDEVNSYSVSACVICHQPSRCPICDKCATNLYRILYPSSLNLNEII